MNIKELAVFGCVIVAMSMFYTGFHSIDNAWNMGSECWDMSITGDQFYNKVELYNLGLLQVFSAMIMFVMAIFLSLIRVNKTIYSSKHNN